MKSKVGLMKARILLMFLVWATIAMAPAAYPQGKTIVRGKIERLIASRYYPAARVRLTLASKSDAGRVVTAYTGSDGMYYFYSVAIGPYNLKVYDAQNVVRSYEINAENKTYTDIKRIRIP